MTIDAITKCLLKISGPFVNLLIKAKGSVLISLQHMLAASPESSVREM